MAQVVALSLPGMLPVGLWLLDWQREREREGLGVLEGATDSVLEVEGVRDSVAGGLGELLWLMLTLPLPLTLLLPLLLGQPLLLPLPLLWCPAVPEGHGEALPLRGAVPVAAEAVPPGAEAEAVAAGAEGETLPLGLPE